MMLHMYTETRACSDARRSHDNDDGVVAVWVCAPGPDEPTRGGQALSLFESAALLMC